MLSLKTQRRHLEDHRTRVLAQIEREVLVARQLVASGHPDRALLALKKKKLQENTLKTLDAFLLNVESMVSTCERVNSFVLHSK
jgi:charged multivesicular body protein 6